MGIPVYNSPLDFYKIKSKNYPLLVGNDIEGDVILSKKEWDNHINKEEIMNDIAKFKDHLRSLNETSWIERVILKNPVEIGRCRGLANHEINVPIIKDISVSTINGLIYSYEEEMQQSAPLHIPSVLHNTDLGKNILHELKNTKFSSNVFCHNYLCYKSFVLKNNKLIGVKNWEYAGFYPPEFEDIIQKHLEFFA
jgi:hypothetical protein